MCGIAGIFWKENRDMTPVIREMLTAMNHRGPDDEGTLHVEDLTLGHKRLSIVDLSPNGKQPMVSFCGRFYLVFNGEIYNHKKIRAKLSGYPFSSDTDTEVILAAYKQFGMDLFPMLEGMFAIGMYDKETSDLLLVRDRLGIKPLYYYQDENTLLFASEIRALLKSGLVPKKISSIALREYIQYQTVHRPNTIIEGIKLLAPGTFLRFNKGRISTGHFWNIQPDEYIFPSEADAKKNVKQLFFNAVEKRMVADVPLGAFLSGGIDSSAVVGAMASLSTNKIDTFSVTFKEQQFSERKYAEIIANKYQTNHHNLELTVEEFKAYVFEALDAMDHPSGDGPNSFVVSKKTKEAGITVALSGLGSDEIFGGYPVFRQLSLLKKYQWMENLPVPMRKIMANVLKCVKPGVASNKLEALLSLKNFDILSSYPLSRRVFLDGEVNELLLDKKAISAPPTLLPDLNLVSNIPDSHFVSSISILEMASYMEHVLLRDTDQMSMASSLEVRVPFLDHDLVRYVLSLPDALKTGTFPKKFFVDAMENVIPDEVWNRKKMGFVLPWELWLKHDLRSFSEEKLIKLGKREAFSQTYITELWERFLRSDNTVKWLKIWQLVVLECWLEKNDIHG